jgi:hypothetical protein
MVFLASLTPCFPFTPSLLPSYFLEGSWPDVRGSWCTCMMDGWIDGLATKDESSAGGKGSVSIEILPAKIPSTTTTPWSSSSPTPPPLVLVLPSSFPPRQQTHATHQFLSRNRKTGSKCVLSLKGPPTTNKDPTNNAVGRMVVVANQKRELTAIVHHTNPQLS